MGGKLLYDVFICHASQDKESLVRPLAEALRDEHLEVWYDEFTLTLGDSIRRSIDKGLRQSRFGIVVLSSAFFSRQWPQYELDGLTEIDMRGRDRVLLPVWHGVDHDEVLQYSPALANRKAVLSSSGLSAVVAEILRVVKPQGSPLVEARDLLLDWGITPPVITDPFWLDIVEASNRLDSFGAAVPDECVWGRWTFPLPPKEGDSGSWGARLAWTAMQERWSNEAEARRISPITHPGQVLDFIRSMPGLWETCEDFPSLLAEYAPQFTIQGFAGDLEGVMDEEFERSTRELRFLQAQDPRFGSGLTPAGQPSCDEAWALRLPDFGGYLPGHVACEYFTGGIFGPTVSPFNHLEHSLWLLSVASTWLPPAIRTMLTAGVVDWGVWASDMSGCQAFSEALWRAIEGQDFGWTRESRSETISCIDDARDNLSLPEDSATLLQRLEDAGFISAYVHDRRKRMNDGA